MYKPDQHERRGASQSGTCRAYGGNLELLRSGTAVGCEAGDGCGAQAILVPQQLRGGNEVAEMLQEALIVGAP
jgi:hypothetical protein